MARFEQTAFVELGSGEGLRVNPLPHLPYRAADGRFVFLQQLTRRCVQLVAVPVERNVASRNHDAAPGARQGIARQRRGWDGAQIDRPHAGIADGALDGLTDLSVPPLLLDVLRGAWTQVAGEVEVLAANDAAIAHREFLEVLQFGGRVDVYLQLRQVDDFSPPSAGSELELMWFVGKDRPESVCRFSHTGISGGAPGAAVN
jgi:hypothetical protein